MLGAHAGRLPGSRNQGRGSNTSIPPPSSQRLAHLCFLKTRPRSSSTSRASKASSPESGGYEYPYRRHPKACSRATASANPSSVRLVGTLQVRRRTSGEQARRLRRTSARSAASKFGTPAPLIMPDQVLRHRSSTFSRAKAHDVVARVYEPDPRFIRRISYRRAWITSVSGDGRN